MARSSKQKRADTVRLNVGGARYTTTRQTLAMIPYFEPLVEGRLPFAVDEEGCAFVDRSGELFALILQFCRSKQRPAEAVLAKHGQELLDECEFQQGVVPTHTSRVVVAPGSQDTTVGGPP